MESFVSVFMLCWNHCRDGFFFCTLYFWSIRFHLGSSRLSSTHISKSDPNILYPNWSYWFPQCFGSVGSHFPIMVYLPLSFFWSFDQSSTSLGHFTQFAFLGPFFQTWPSTRPGREAERRTTEHCSVSSCNLTAPSLSLSTKRATVVRPNQPPPSAPIHRTATHFKWANSCKWGQILLQRLQMREGWQGKIGKSLYFANRGEMGLRATTKRNLFFEKVSLQKTFSRNVQNIQRRDSPKIIIRPKKIRKIAAKSGFAWSNLFFQEATNWQLEKTCFYPFSHGYHHIWRILEFSFE